MSYEWKWKSFIQFTTPAPKFPFTPPPAVIGRLRRGTGTAANHAASSTRAAPTRCRVHFFASINGVSASFKVPSTSESLQMSSAVSRAEKTRRANH